MRNNILILSIDIGKLLLGLWQLRFRLMLVLMTRLFNNPRYWLLITPCAICPTIDVSIVLGIRLLNNPSYCLLSSSEINIARV
jgi:hypothetical protein